MDVEEAEEAEEEVRCWHIVDRAHVCAQIDDAI